MEVITMKQIFEQASEQLRKYGSELSDLFAQLRKSNIAIYTPTSVDFVQITIEYLKETTGKDYTPGRFLDKDGNTYSPEDLTKLPRRSTVLEIVTLGYIKNKAGELKRVAFGVEFDTGYNGSDEITKANAEYYYI